MNIVALVQARMGSTRLPNKVMKEISGVPMIGLLLQRLKTSKKINKIVITTSESENNQVLLDYAKSLGFDGFAGSENNVLERFYQAAKLYQADVIIRITGDCPLIDPELVDSIVESFLTTNADYVSNTIIPTYPDGLDTEVFSFRALERAYKEAETDFQREHVTPFLKEEKHFKIKNIECAQDFSNERWTVDEEEDFQLISGIFKHFLPRLDFSWRDILDFKKTNSSLFKVNQHLIRNEGAMMGTGQKLWKRAKRVIPGGNLLLSKRAEMFLPEHWPSYFSKAKGCTVWDLDQKPYIDMSIMGIGTNTLGYGHPEVDEAVKKTIENGNMSSLNCPEEVYLAEKLIELHPWAEMVRFARTGGEANAISIRIARAASGKDKVAICGYHGWHDWYLSANLAEDDSLSGHLLPGLDPNGVPKNLKGTVFPFQYNKIEELQALVSAHDIGVIKMEVSRNHGPEDNFLHKVRELASDKNIVLIFDECTSGFRQTYGGLHKLYGVEPDIALFGKALGNGYAITSIIGRRSIMEAAQTTFISSTFWSERIGPTAGLKTLDVMARIKSWDTITDTGTKIKSKWKSLADKYEIKLDLWGLPALAGFTIQSKDSLAYKTFITQEMLKKGYLAGNSVYVCTEHTDEIVSEYFDKLEPIFSTIQECENGKDIYKLLEGPVCHAGFKRLN